MTSEKVLYDNRIIPKEGFRAFVYGANGKQKLAMSWDEYEVDIASGVWVSTKEQAEQKFKTRKQRVAKAANEEPSPIEALIRELCPEESVIPDVEMNE